MPRVVLDALAEAQFVEHLQVEPRALLDALCLDQLAFAVEKVDALAHLDFDGFDRPQGGAARRHIVAAGVDGEATEALLDGAGEWVEQRQRLDLVVEQGHPQGVLAVLRREDVDHLAAHTEMPAPEVEVGSVVLHRRQPLEDLALIELLPLFQVQDHVVVVGRVADAVDRADGRHDDHVTPLHQAFCGRQPHLLDVLIDRAVLLDEQILARDVGLGLVIVVVADKVLNGVVREELAKFRVQLRGECLVRRHDDGRSPQSGDHIGHGVRLARASHPQQGLKGEPVLDALGQLLDRGGLVAGRRERLVEAIRTAWEFDDRGGLNVAVRMVHMSSDRDAACGVAPTVAARLLLQLRAAPLCNATPQCMRCKRSVHPVRHPRFMEPE